MMFLTYFLEDDDDAAYEAAARKALSLVLSRQSSSMNIGFVADAMPPIERIEVLSRRAIAWPGTEIFGDTRTIVVLPAAVVRFDTQIMADHFRCDLLTLFQRSDPWVFLSDASAREGKLQFASVGHERYCWLLAPESDVSELVALGFSPSADIPDWFNEPMFREEGQS